MRAAHNLTMSVVVLNHNGAHDLPSCLASVQRNLSPSVREVLVVDNASNDGSLELVRDRFSWSELIASDSNLGCAGGRNLGWQQATGDIVLFLDSDAEVAPGCLRSIIDRFADPGIGIVGCTVKDRLDRTTIQEAGMSIDRFGFMILFTERQHELAPFYVSGCSFAVLRSLGEKFGVFDERFFIFEEEIDLCWRYQLAGFRVAVAADAIVFHTAGTNYAGGAVPDSHRYETSERRIYLRERNAMNALLKNYSTGSLLKVGPAYVAFLFGETIIAFLLLRFRWGWQYIRAIAWNLVNLRETMKRRRIVQALRRIGDEKLPFDRRLGKWIVFRQIGIPRVRT